jgi:hypothetical protein
MEITTFIVRLTGSNGSIKRTEAGGSVVQGALAALFQKSVWIDTQKTM